MSDKETTYPWAMLYNLESQRSRSVVSDRPRTGRPRNPIPRTHATVMMTSEESKILRDLTYNIQELFVPAKVSRSQVVGLSLHIVKTLIDKYGLPEEVSDWPSLVLALTEKADE